MDAVLLIQSSYLKYKRYGRRGETIVLVGLNDQRPGKPGRSQLAGQWHN